MVEDKDREPELQKQVGEFPDKELLEKVGKARKEKFLKLAKQRARDSRVAGERNEMAGIFDIKMKVGDQWPADVLNLRTQDKMNRRPVITVNVIRPMIRKIMGDYRQNELDIKVRPVGGGASTKDAEIREGMFREISYKSDAANIIFPFALEQAISSGYGHWRLLTEYESPRSFNQVIRIRRIANQFSVWRDWSSEDFNFNDGNFCFIVEKMPTAEFKSQYPDASLRDFTSTEGTAYEDWWMSDGTITVAEYYYKEPLTKKIGLTEDGNAVDLDDRSIEYYKGLGINIEKVRSVKTFRVMWAKITEDDILEGPQEIPSMYIPVVTVIGEEEFVQGERITSSIIRDAIDPQRLYNYSRSQQAEVLSSAPKAPYLATSDQIKNHEPMWDRMNLDTTPYLLYNDNNGKGPPIRINPSPVPTGLMNESQLCLREIKEATGITDAYLGNAGNETSGKAINVRSRQSGFGISPYVDNLARAITHTGKIILDMIPRVYDTHRTVTLMDKKSENKVEINKPIEYPHLNGGKETENDMTVGEFELVASITKSSATQREETAQKVAEIIQYSPSIAEKISDILVAQYDLPQSVIDEIVARLRPQQPQQPNPQQIMGQQIQATNLESQKADVAIKHHKLQEMTKEKESQMRQMMQEEVLKVLAALQHQQQQQINRGVTPRVA